MGRDWGDRRTRGNRPPCHGRLRNGTLAGRLAALPATRSAHATNPPRLPERESASNVVDAATIIPSTDSGVSVSRSADARRRSGSPPCYQLPRAIKRPNCSCFAANGGQARHRGAGSADRLAVSVAVDAVGTVLAPAS